MKYSLLFTGFLGLILLASCSDFEDFTTDSSANLAFSLDTLRFDTVFTQLGSATRFFKVYNRNDEAIKISRVYIEGNETSPFRLNIDGIPANEATDVIVWPNDSIYIFAEVTIDPDQPLSVSPFVIEERVMFETNGNQQEVLMEAWGQNANYFPSRFNKAVPVVLSCDNGTIVWDDPKPYVIYGEVFIDSCLLSITAGRQIYVHGGIAQNDAFGIFNDGFLYTLGGGSIQVRGTVDDPVIIQGDRLEEPFLDEAGQWNGIILGRGSKGNIFQYTTIRNSRFGVLVDSTAELTMQNTQIYNTVSSGIIGFASTVKAENSLIYNNGGPSVQFIIGGNYDFTYCTLASYGVDASALSMSNFFCYDDPFACQVREDLPLRARFKNSILFGSRRDELSLLDVTGGQIPEFFDIQFEDCIIRIDDLLEQQEGLYKDFLNTLCNPCFNGTSSDALFVSTLADDYRLDTLSIAEGRAAPLMNITTDLEGNNRDPSTPDIGCFEYQN